MKIEIVLGRPCAGKTAMLIKTANAHEGPSLFVSLENPSDYLRQRGLLEKVALLVPAEFVHLTEQSIVSMSRKSKAALVAIDNLELLPSEMDLRLLADALESAGVRMRIPVNSATHSDSIRPLIPVNSATFGAKRRWAFFETMFTRPI